MSGMSGMSDSSGMDGLTNWASAPASTVAEPQLPNCWPSTDVESVVKSKRDAQTGPQRSMKASFYSKENRMADGAIHLPQHGADVNISNTLGSKHRFF